MGILVNTCHHLLTLLKVGQQHSLHLKKKFKVLYDSSFNGERLGYLTYELGHN